MEVTDLNRVDVESGQPSSDSEGDDDVFKSRNPSLSPSPLPVVDVAVTGQELGGSNLGRMGGRRHSTYKAITAEIGEPHLREPSAAVSRSRRPSASHSHHELMATLVNLEGELETKPKSPNALE